MDAMTIAIVEDEADRAQQRYGDFSSTHEALGVLIEEFDELKAAIHRNNMDLVALESKQLAAVALRLFVHAVDPTSHESFVKRSIP